MANLKTTPLILHPEHGNPINPSDVTRYATWVKGEVGIEEHIIKNS